MEVPVRLSLTALIKDSRENSLLPSHSQAEDIVEHQVNSTFPTERQNLDQHNRIYAEFSVKPVAAPDQTEFLNTASLEYSSNTPTSSIETDSSKRSWAGFSCGIASGLLVGWLVVVSVATAFQQTTDTHENSSINKFRFGADAWAKTSLHNIDHLKLSQNNSQQEKPTGIIIQEIASTETNSQILPEIINLPPDEIVSDRNRITAVTESFKPKSDITNEAKKATSHTISDEKTEENASKNNKPDKMMVANSHEISEPYITKKGINTEIVTLNDADSIAVEAVDNNSIKSQSYEIFKKYNDNKNENINSAKSVDKDNINKTNIKLNNAVSLTKITDTSSTEEYKEVLPPLPLRGFRLTSSSKEIKTSPKKKIKVGKKYRTASANIRQNKPRSWSNKAKVRRSSLGAKRKRKAPVQAKKSAGTFAAGIVAPISRPKWASQVFRTK